MAQVGSNPMAQLAPALADNDGGAVNTFRPDADIGVTAAYGAGLQSSIAGKVFVRPHVNQDWRVRSAENSAQFVGRYFKI